MTKPKLEHWTCVFALQERTATMTSLLDPDLRVKAEKDHNQLCVPAYSYKSVLKAHKKLNLSAFGAPANEHLHNVS